jgi:Protein of unknown function (DUF1302)
MSTKLQRAGLLGSVAAVSLLSAMNAGAVETKFGDVDIVFDTTVSFGATVRTAGREDEFLPEGNGGPVDPRSGVGDSLVIINEGPTPSFSAASTGNFRYTNNPNNHDGGINTDDGRLNFDAGDLLGATFKANHDLQMSWQNYKLFARAIGFYDVILADKGAGDRSLVTDDAIGDVGRNYELLDFFVSADYTIAEMPVNLRVGKQVINWGESTFILNGNNVFNPIDVAAFRRPGSEIKEALVPVNAVSGSISLPFDVSLSGYYALDWEPFELDPSGTAFSGADVVAAGTGLGGNNGRASLLSGSPFSGMRRICDLGAADGNTGLAVVYNQGLLPNPTNVNVGGLGAPATGLGNGYVDCLDSPFVNATTPYTIGQHEGVKLGLIDTLGAEGVTRIGQGVLTRDRDLEADDMNQFGVSARWYAEELGGTEFGFYYQNYHSRLPFVSEVARTMEVGIAAGGHSTQLSGIAGKFATPVGCLNTGSPTPGGFADPRLGSGVGGASPGFLAGTGISDPQDLLNATSLGAAFAITGANGGVPFTNPNPAIGLDNIYNAAVLQCALVLFQSGLSPTAGAALGVAAAPALFDGAEILTYASDIGLLIEYPEDIGIFGFSFNTTLFGWGIQADFTYRNDAPFQVDTDSLTIAAAMEQCAFASVGDLMNTFEQLGTIPGHTCLSGGSAGSATGIPISGVLRNEMYTAQIGTTSTYTASDWWVDFIGADLGVLVTEAGMVYVPNVEDTWLDKYDPDGLGPLSPTVRPNQYQNIGCQGSDLPLGGLLGLDRKSSKNCRPNDFSAGLVLLARVEYNNFMDTGFTVAPQIVYSYDFEGTTPSPYGNYLEDRQAVSLGVTGTLNNNFRVGASYSNFFGGHIANKAKDTDFASLTASYTF